MKVWQIELLLSECESQVSDKVIISKLFDSASKRSILFLVLLALMCATQSFFGLLDPDLFLYLRNGKVEQFA